MIKTVLCIEDDSVTQFLNKIELEDAGFCEKMEEAWNGQVALDYFEVLSKDEDGLSKAPEIILLDLNMPVMDGWEFLEIFLAKYPQFAEKAKVFVVTSSINPADKIRSTNEDSVKGFLSKPLDGAQIEVLNQFIQSGIKKI